MSGVKKTQPVHIRLFFYFQFSEAPQTTSTADFRGTNQKLATQI